MFTVIFWRDAIERAIKTAAQALILSAGAGAGFDLYHFDFKAGAISVVGGIVLSLLTSIASLPFGQPGTPSLVAPIPDSMTAAPALPIGSDQTPIV
jgi:Putative lactococcus lactis phage r1t holin